MGTNVTYKNVLKCLGVVKSGASVLIIYVVYAYIEYTVYLHVWVCGCVCAHIIHMCVHVYIILIIICESENVK